MNPRYERNIPALSEAECEILQRKRVLVVGCGGLGGHLIDMLARIGVGALRVVDGDVFEPSNLNRQLLSEVPLLGVSKARAAAARIIPRVKEISGISHLRKILYNIFYNKTDGLSNRENIFKGAPFWGAPFLLH